MTAPSILARLRDETRAEHEAIEGVVPLMDPGVTRGVYAAYLARLHGYYAPLEPRLEAALAVHPFAGEFARRRKTPRLAQDLARHGVTGGDLDALPRCASLPDVGDPSRALGCLYVLEGSTLGAQLLTRHLVATLGLDPAADCAFLACYGADLGANWRAFGAALTAHVAATGEGDAVVAAARATFATLRRWLAG